MSLKRKIIQNTAIQIAGKAAGTALALIVAGMVLRYLTESQYGQYTTVLSFLQLFGILMDFGLYIVLIKQISQIDDTTKPIINTIFTLRVVAGVVLFGIAPLLAWLIGLRNPNYDPVVITGIALSGLLFFSLSLNQLFSGIFQKFLRTDWVALAEVIGKVVLILATLLAIHFDLNVLGILAALVVSAVINVSVVYLAARRFIRLRLQWSKTTVRLVLRDAWPIALSIGFSLLYFKGDTIILTFFASQEVIGEYGAPYKVLEVLITFPAMFVGLILPLLGAAWQQGNLDRVRYLVQQSFNAIVLVAVPLAAGAIALAPQIMRLLTGDGYESSAGLLQILILATSMIYLGTLFGYVVPGIDKQRQMLFGYAWIAVSSLIGYLIFIPLYSSTGAAWMTVYAETMVVVIAGWITLRTIKLRLRLAVLLKSLLASSIMYFLLQWLESFFDTTSTLLGLAVLVPTGIAAYGIATILTKAVQWRELRQLIGRSSY